MWENGAWKGPIDILAENSPFFSLSGAVDSKGYLNLIYTGLNEYLLWTQSLSASALSAREWTAPFPIAGFPQLGGLVFEASNQALHFIFASGTDNILHHEMLAPNGDMMNLSGQMPFLFQGYLLKTNPKGFMNEAGDHSRCFSND